MSANHRTIKKSFWYKIVCVPIFMFGFAYLMVPLYDVLCQVTGFGGRTEQIDNSYQVKQASIDEQHIVSVGFFSSTMPGFPVDFKPNKQSLDVVPGKFYTASYTARNTTDKTLVGQAVPSVTPAKAAIHFKKLECFCFSKQTLKPNESVEMSVRFLVEPDIDPGVKDISLSYNFFKLTS